MIRNILTPSSWSTALILMLLGLALSMVMAAQILVLSTTRKLPCIRITEYTIQTTYVHFEKLCDWPLMKNWICFKNHILVHWTKLELRNIYLVNI